MKGITSELRQELLAALAQHAATGEAAHEDEKLFWPRFLPIPDHLRAFEPEVVLVLGDRGAGKSQLFQAIIAKGGLERVRPFAPKVRFPKTRSERTHWLTAYPAGDDFCDAASMGRLLARHSDRDGAAKRLWFAYLVRTVAKLMDEDARTALSRLVTAPGGSATAVYDAVEEAGDLPLLALDRLDRRLRESDAFVFLGYDELDLLGEGDWELMQAAIRGLIGCWTSYARRWQRIRAKLFLRTDLFHLHGHTLGADLPKLAANRVDLLWTDRLLYAALTKRLINSHPGFTRLAKLSGLKLVETEELGLMPIFSDTDELRPFIERIAGTYMGTDKRKGQTWIWLLDHVRDGRDRASPRSLGRLIEQAALEEQQEPRADEHRLLHPIAMRRALDRVSQENVLTAREFPWLGGLRDRLRSKEVPIERRALLRLLGQRWDDWARNRPPADDPADLLDRLMDLGIVRGRGIDRFDVPDIYLAGLEMKRRGGVKRR